MTGGDTIIPLLDAEAVAEAAAEMFVAAANAAVNRNGRFVVVLAGGSTPRQTYQRLAEAEFAARIPWESTWVLFGDERHVAGDSAESNARMARETLLEKVPIPADQILSIDGSSDQPARAAWFYEQELRELYPDTEWPRFDLVLLGLGEDGHTASLFPDTGALTENEKWVTANWLPDPGRWRISLTFPAINHAALILFLITGSNKAWAVSRVFGDVSHEEPLPAEQIQPIDGDCEVFLDHAAASELDGDTEINR